MNAVAICDDLGEKRKKKGANRIMGFIENVIYLNLIMRVL